MQRAGSDYYEYRDTVLTTVTTFRPEWIKQLCFVDDNSPDNAKVQWNNGILCINLLTLLATLTFTM